MKNMKNFNVEQLAKSLIMPTLTLAYGATALVDEHTSGTVAFTGYDTVRSTYFPLVTIILGGLLPVLVTILKNIHTEKYFLKRLCMYLALWAGS